MKSVALCVIVFGAALAQLKIPKNQSECLNPDSFKVYFSLIRPSTDLKVIRLDYEDKFTYKTLDIMNYVLALTSKHIKQKMWKRVPEGHFNFTTEHEYVEITTSEQQKVCPIHSALRHWRIIVAKDPQMLYQYLNSKQSEEFSNGLRALTTLLFTSKGVRPEDAGNALIYLWNRFGALEVVAQLRNSCRYHDDFVTFKPFERTKWGFGQIQIHHFQNVQDRPSVLRNCVGNLQGYPLRVSIFQRHPTASAFLPELLSNSKIYKIPSTMFGIDGMTLHYMSKLMNFTVVICKDPECMYFGLTLKNKTAIGSLGQVVQRNVDLQANARFIMDYGVGKFEFTTYYTFDKVCLVVSKAKLIPIWISILLMFRHFSGAAMILSFFLIIVANKFLCPKLATMESAMEVYCIMLQQPKSNFAHSGIRTSKRILIASTLIFFMVISTIFIGGLYRAFSTKTYFPDINTLEEFYEKGIRVKSSFDPFQGSPLPLYRQLSKRLQLDPKTEFSLVFVAAGEGAAVERADDAKFLIATRFYAPDGSPLVHIIPDCPKKLYLGYIVPEGSPYLHEINYFLKRFQESGLSNKWYLDFTGAMEMKSMMHYETSDRKGKVISLKDIQIAFWILGCGFSVAVVVLLGEIFNVESRKRQSKNYISNVKA